MYGPWQHYWQRAQDGYPNTPPIVHPDQDDENWEDAWEPIPYPGATDWSRSIFRKMADHHNIGYTKVRRRKKKAA